MLTDLYLRGRARRRLRELGSRDTESAQRETLSELVQRASSTRLGREHGFSSIRTVEDFRSAVPLRSYEQHFEEYWSARFPHISGETWPSQPRYFALSSGTTAGRSKQVPVTDETLQSIRRGSLDLVCFHLACRPESQLLRGKSFILGGSTDLKSIAPGIHEGDLSGILAVETPWWARSQIFPPPNLALISDWDEKASALSAAAVNEDIRALSGVPPWILLLARAIEKSSGKGARIIDWFPNFELLVHGGVNVEPYRSELEALLAGSAAELREIYAASEGFFAAQDRSACEGLRLIPDNGVFFELVPLDELSDPHPSRLSLAEAEVGVPYALAVTTCSGLWAYLIGDILELVSKEPPRIRVLGRVARDLSIFGEHLQARAVETAVIAAADAVGMRIAEFTVGGMLDENRQGIHIYVIEPAPGSMLREDAKESFVSTIDETLQNGSDDYATLRINDSRLRRPRIEVAESGTFMAWMRYRGKLGGQHKVPRVLTSHAELEAFLSFVEDKRQHRS